MPPKSNLLLRKAFGEQITDHLRDALVGGELKPGERLTEEDLAAHFGVSRGPVRDAFRQLANERLVRTGRSGTYAIGISESDIGELYILRQAIETLAASLAMDRTPLDGWDEMAQAVKALDDAADAADEHSFAAADIYFHTLIYELSGHQRLNDVWNQYAPILTRLLQETIFDRGDLHSTAERHRLLLQQLMAKDHEAVATELRDHLEESHQRMIAALRKRAGTTPEAAAKHGANPL